MPQILTVVSGKLLAFRRHETLPRSLELRGLPSLVRQVAGDFQFSRFHRFQRPGTVLLKNCGHLTGKVACVSHRKLFEEKLELLLEGGAEPGLLLGLADPTSAV